MQEAPNLNLNNVSQAEEVFELASKDLISERSYERE